MDASSPTQIRITHDNPAYGYVDGAMRGNQIWRTSSSSRLFLPIQELKSSLPAVLRPQQLRPFQFDLGKAAGRFQREMTGIVAKVRTRQNFTVYITILIQLNSASASRTRLELGYLLLLSIRTPPCPLSTSHPTDFAKMQTVR